MMSNYNPTFATFFAAFLLDRATKIFALSNLPIFENYGISFSLFQGAAFFPVLLGLVLLIFLKDMPKIWLALFLAGAAGNALDRIIYGYVIDWIYVGLWINIADILLCAGAAGMLFKDESC